MEIEEETDIDLNREPLEPPRDSMLGFGSLLDDIDTVHGRIEERIRQLEEVTSRARQRQRRRQVETTINLDALSGPVAESSQSQGGVASREITEHDRKKCKRDYSHLISKALDTDTDAQKVSDTGCFFDCNICLDAARDPVLTCCGHLFCWRCFYQLPQAEPNAKVCPVCMGEVEDINIIPIYGNGSKTFNSKSELAGSQIPPRPHARRIESARQQQFNRIEEALRRVITNRIGPDVQQTQSQDSDYAHATSEQTGGELPTSHVPPGAEADSSRGSRVLQFSRLLSEEAASLSSLSSNLSSALSSAERIVENLEEIVHLYPLRSRAHELLADDRDSVASIVALMHSENSTMETGSEINSRMPPS